MGFVMPLRSRRFRPAPVLATAAALLLFGAIGLTAMSADAATLASCPRRATIVGSEDDDHIEGTPGDDVICAGAGDDVIDGKGGSDTIYAGAGGDTITTGDENDYIYAGSGSDRVFANGGTDLVYGDNTVGKATSDPYDTGADGNDIIMGGLGSDPIEAGGGNDVIFTGGDGSGGGGVSFTHGGPGNDIIMSDFRFPTLAEYFFGDEGSDLLWPNPVRLNPLGNVAFGGAGNDMIILLNGLRDSAVMDDLDTSVTVPLGEFCSVSVPLPEPLGAGNKGTFGCSIPVDFRIPGIADGFQLNAGIDSSGHPTVDVSVKPAPELQLAEELLEVARGNFPRELCVCDPPKLPGWGVFLSDTQS
jgi:Ca2+-binding RTX toxin-like protein